MIMYGNQLVEMYGTEDVELMGDPEGLELEGEGLEDLDGEGVRIYGEDGEYLGFSIMKAVKKVGSGIKKGAKATVAATKYVAKNPGRLAAVALAPATGGASLLTMKAVRKPVVRTAKATGNVIAQGAKAVAGNKLVQKAVGTGLRAGAAYATGGASEAAFQAPKLMSMLSPKKVGAAPKALPAAARTALPKAAASFNPFPKRNTTVRIGPTGASIETAPAAAEKPGLSPAIMIGGGVAAAAVLGLVLMGKKGK